MFFRFFFFFFQAEDGIRDGTVTGVQTCALPISAFEDTILGLVARKRFERAGQHEGQAFERLGAGARSEEHTSELQSQFHLVCRLLLEKKNILSACRRSEEHMS